MNNTENTEQTERMRAAWREYREIHKDRINANNREKRRRDRETVAAFNEAAKNLISPDGQLVLKTVDECNAVVEVLKKVLTMTAEQRAAAQTIIDNL